MFNKVLVPLDGSELAEVVLPYVEAVCSRCEPTEIILFQVRPPLSGQTGSVFRPAGDAFPTPMLPDSAADLEAALHPVYRDQVLAAARSEVEADLARVSARLCNAGASVRVEMAFGRPAEEIVDYAEREGVDLIIMSTHGLSGLTRLILGSVFDRVLSATTLPILLIRPPRPVGYPFPPQPEIEI